MSASLATSRAGALERFHECLLSGASAKNAARSSHAFKKNEVKLQADMRPRRRGGYSSEALMRELGSGLEVPTQGHDMGEVLTREVGSGLEVPTREHEFGLDAPVPHDAWFCGLKHGHTCQCHECQW